MASNVHGLGKTGSEKNPKDDGNEMFSQTGSQSGTGVLRPIKTDDTSADIMKAAREQSSKGDTGAKQVGLRILMYKNGFKVGDEGVFRRNDDPANKQFLEDIRNGNLPQELEQQIDGGNGNVRVDIVDKTSEDFEPPKPKFAAFTGAGFSMGGASKPVGTSFKDASPAEYKAGGDGGETLIQIVLPNRQRHRLTVKLTATVLDIYQHVMTLTDKRPFELRAGYPPKSLADPSATVADARLQKETIQVRG